MMARPGVLDAFFLQDQQRLVQRVQAVGGGGMVIGAGGRAPVAQQQVHVHEPAVDLVLARLDVVDHAVAERHGREARGAGQALLAGRIHRVHVPLVDQHGRAGQRGDRVHDGECVVAVGDLDQRLGVGLHARGGFGVHKRDDARVGVGLERILELLRVDLLAPGILDDDGNAAGALHVLDHATAEHAVAAHDDLVARGDHVHEAVLHPDRARAGHRKGERVLGLERIAQQALELLHHVDEDRVEIADRRQAHRCHDARVDLGWSRAQERALRGMERLDAFRRSEWVHGVTPCQRWSEKAVFFAARLDPDRLARVGLVEYLDGQDPAVGGVLDFHRPPRRDIAGLHPVADQGAVDAEAAGNFCLAAEDCHQAFSAVHGSGRG